MRLRDPIFSFPPSTSALHSIYPHPDFHEKIFRVKADDTPGIASPNYARSS